MAEDKVREWFAARGASLPAAPPVCYRALSGHNQAQAALLCSHKTTMSPEHAEVRLDVVGVRGGRIVSLQSLPVAVLPLSGPLCIGSVERESRNKFITDESPAPVVELGSVVGPDGQTLILRDVLGALCRDGVGHIDWLSMYAGLAQDSRQRVSATAEPVCESRGVYGWVNDKFEKRRDGVVLAGPSPLAKLAGGRLPGACVDPVASCQSSRSWAGPDSPRMMHSDLDLDGDGRTDVVLNAGAARWETNYVLYVQRESCGYYVGWIPASESPRRLPEKSHGLFDLLTSNDDCPMAFPGHTMDGYCDTIWRFNGTSYVRYREVGTQRRPAGIQP
jgi:hypothetical protein